MSDAVLLWLGLVLIAAAVLWQVFDWDDVTYVCDYFPHLDGPDELTVHGWRWQVDRKALEQGWTYDKGSGVTRCPLHQEVKA